MKSIILVALVLTALAAAPRAQGEQPQEVERNGDYLQVGIPLLALGLTFLVGDENSDGDAGSSYVASGVALGGDWLHMNGSPRHDLALAVGRTELATYSLKYSVNSERPNGGGQSFPSGHTSIAFAGAEFIRKQYGWWWGVPSYAAASYVGWSRVETKNHWTTDVLAGAAIGILSNHDGLSLDLPTPWGGMLSIAPTLAPGLAAPPFAAAEALGDAPSDSVLEAMEGAPAPFGAGLRFEVRF